MLVSRPNKHEFNKIQSLGSFDQIVFNDLDLLPLAALLTNNGHAAGNRTGCHLDLHEYFPDQGVGLIWRLLFRRYGQWLQSIVHTTSWSTVTTVSPSIANLYVKAQIFAEVSCILSAPEKHDLEVVQCAADRIDLIYHGLADLHRGLLDLVDLISTLDNRFHLNFILVGSQRNISKLKKKAKPYVHRIHFLPSVETQQIVNAINQFDIEVIFFPPITLNLFHALPNKYFEAVQANLAVLHGPSPSMQSLSEQFGFGIATKDWNFLSLSTTLNSLTSKTINDLKTKSNEATNVLCSEVEGVKFMKLISGA